MPHLRCNLLSSLYLILTCGAGYGQEKTDSTADTLFFHLPDVVVTAIESKAPGSTSLLPASTIEHVQPVTAADLMQLLPGGLTGDAGAPYFIVREITFRDGITQSSSVVAEGMQIVMDGSPLHHNAETGSPYHGSDTRFLSMNGVKQVEVVRGIPSAQYGNLTNGMLIMKTRTGEMPLTLGLRYNPDLKQYTAGKGFRISPQGHTLNLLADYTSRNDFHTGGLRLANQYNWTTADGQPLLLNLSYTTRIGGEKLYVSNENHSWQKRQDHRLTLGSEWKPGRRLLQSLSLRIDLSASKSRDHQYRLSSNPKSIATDATTSGEWLATVLPNNYYSELLTEGMPLYAEAEAIATTRLPLASIGSGGNGQVELKAGASGRSEGNRGRGTQFDALQPPAQMSRPESYRDVPFRHNGALFAEALFRWNRLRVQAGIRYQVMMSRDYPLMGSVEPRLNLTWNAFSSPHYALRLKAGAGRMSYMPTVDRLYPAAVYNDLVSFFYNDPEGGHSLGIASVHAPGAIQNKDLRPTVNRKVEGGFSLETPVVNLDATLFFERQTGGFGSATDYLPFTYRKYDYLDEAGLRPEYQNGQVMVNGTPVPYREQTDFTSISLPVNASITHKHGLELTADFGTFHPLRTSFIADGRWLRIRQRTTILTSVRKSYDVDGVAYPLAGYYDKTFESAGNETVAEQMSTNFRFITRIPRIGLVTTLTLQMVWMDKIYTRYNGGTDTEVWPLYWSEADGVRHPFTQTEREDPRFALLMQQTNAYSFARDSYKPYGLLNLRVSKEFTRLVTLSFFVNNLADMRPSRYRDSVHWYYQQNASPFFGIEMQVKL